MEMCHTYRVKNSLLQKQHVGETCKYLQMYIIIERNLDLFLQNNSNYLNTGIKDFVCFALIHPYLPIFFLIHNVYLLCNEYFKHTIWPHIGQPTDLKNIVTDESSTGYRPCFRHTCSYLTLSMNP